MTEKYREAALAMANDQPSEGTKEGVEKKPPEQEPFSEQVVREAKVLEKILEVEYSFLEGDHEAAAYLARRLCYLFPDHHFQVRIADNEGEPNALSLPNGTIIVTKGLLRLIETQDELDFVLAHEATHYLRRHTQEITRVLHEAKKRYQTMAAIGNTVRLLGATRLAEYEADIRAVVELSEQRVNPAAARSFFVRLDEYQEAKGLTGLSIAHGKNIARIVNIGAMAALFDSRATMAEHAPLPKHIKAYADTKGESWLLQELSEAVVDREIAASVKRASLGEVALTLSRSRQILAAIGDDPHRRRERENYEYFHRIAAAGISEKVAEAVPEASAEGRAFLVHTVLATVCGLTDVEANGTPFEPYVRSLDEIADEAVLWEYLALATPETFDALGVVIPDLGGIVGYVQTIIRRANENELFEAEEGFDSDRYIFFVQNLLGHFHDLSKAWSFEPLNLADFTPVILEQGLLSLNFKESNQPALEFLGKLIDRGIVLDPGAAMKCIADAKYIPGRDTSDFTASVEAGLVRQHPFLPIRKKIYDVFMAYKEQRLGGHGVDAVEASVYVQMIKNIHPKNLEEIVAMLEYAADIEEKENLSLQANFLEVCTDVIIHGGASLPDTVFERTFTILKAVRSHHILCNIFLADLINFLFNKNVLELDEFESQEKKIAAYQELIQLVIGTHPTYANNPPQPLQSLRQSLFFSFDDYRKVHPDNAILRDLAYGYYTILTPQDGVPPLSKTDLRMHLQIFCDAYFPYVDYLPNTTESVQKIDILSKLFETYTFSLDDALDQEILLSLSMLIGDPVLRSRLQSAIIRRKLQSEASFDARLAVLFQDPRTKLSLNRTQLQTFIEKDMQTHEECDKAERVLASYGDALANPERIGGAVLLELLSFIVESKNKRTLLATGLESSASDRELKKQILKITLWSHADHGVDTNDNFIIAALDDSHRRVNQLYGMDDISRFFIIRELLIGENGLLLSAKDRKWLLKYFFKTHIAQPQREGQAQLHAVLKETLDAMVENAEPDLLFFALAPVLQERLFRLPAATTPWENIIDDVSEGDKAMRKKLHQIHANLQAIQESAKFGQANEEEIKKALSGREEEARVAFFVDDLLKDDPFDVKAAEPRLSVEKFMLKLAESFGAPGIRLLQIIGQYVEVSPELSALFRDAYDRVKRQSKPTSIHTMRREWPDFRSEVARVVERRGGGSLMSAYQCEMTDGSETIVKVLNANALLFVTETMRMLRRTFDLLVEKNPERYRLARLALDDIEEWILQDISYDRFLENDKHFRDAHHGQTYEGHEYGIYISQSRAITPDGSDNLYVKVEEFIHGSTLVRPEELEGHDMKQIVSVIVKNHFDQITRPVKAADGSEEKTISLVHADVHPGNFMVMTTSAGEKRVAVIDRNNFIELNQIDRDFLLSFLLPMEADARAAALVDYVQTHPKVAIEAGAKAAILAQLKTLFSAASAPAKTVSDAALVLKEHGIYVPLKLTLLIKNFNGLDYLCRQAGFAGGVMEAYWYGGR